MNIKGWIARLIDARSQATPGLHIILSVTGEGETQVPGVAPRHNLCLIDTGSYLHPPQHEEPADNIHHEDTGSYLEVLDTGVYLHAPTDEPSIEGKFI